MTKNIRVTQKFSYQNSIRVILSTFRSEGAGGGHLTTIYYIIGTYHALPLPYPARGIQGELGKLLIICVQWLKNSNQIEIDGQIDESNFNREHRKGRKTLGVCACVTIKRDLIEMLSDLF